MLLIAGFLLEIAAFSGLGCLKEGLIDEGGHGDRLPRLRVLFAPSGLVVGIARACLPLILVPMDGPDVGGIAQNTSHRGCIPDARTIFPRLLRAAILAGGDTFHRQPPGDISYGEPVCGIEGKYLPYKGRFLRMHLVIAAFLGMLHVAIPKRGASPRRVAGFGTSYEPVTGPLQDAQTVVFMEGAGDIREELGLWGALAGRHGGKMHRDAALFGLIGQHELMGQLAAETVLLKTDKGVNGSGMHEGTELLQGRPIQRDTGEVIGKDTVILDTISLRLGISQAGINLLGE